MPLLSDLFATQSPTAATVPVPVWLDLASVVVGSVSGLLYARERKLDLVGYIGLAILCGLGGGLIRDTIMQVGDVYMLKSQGAILMCIASGVLGFLFPGSISAHPHLLEWVDIISVGLFAAAGTDKAILYQLNFCAIVLMGTITGVGGGMLRDIFLGEVPRIFRRSNWYALCAIAGSLVYLASAVTIGLRKDVAAALCVLVTLLLRRISLRYHLLSPADVDLAPVMRRVGHDVVESARQTGVAEAERLQQRRDREHNTTMTLR